MLLICILVRGFFTLFLAAFGATAAFASHGDWSSANYYLPAQHWSAQQADIALTARGPPLTSENLAPTGGQCANSDDLRTSFEVAVLGDVSAFSGSSIATKKGVDTPNPGTRPGATDAEAGGASYYDRYKKADGIWNWPENMGFSGKPTEATLPIGTRIDRYGSPNGAFMSPDGTPIDQRAMAPGSMAEPHHVYEVQKPLPVIQGKIAPVFGKPGGGTQMLPNFSDRVNVQWLLDEGHLKKIN